MIIENTFRQITLAGASVAVISRRSPRNRYGRTRPRSRVRVARNVLRSDGTPISVFVFCSPSRDRAVGTRTVRRWGQRANGGGPVMEMYAQLTRYAAVFRCARQLGRFYENVPFGPDGCKRRRAGCTPEGRGSRTRRPFCRTNSVSIVGKTKPLGSVAGTGGATFIYF